MGIKNLAFCVSDAKVDDQGGHGKNAIKAEMHLVDWKRIDVAEEIARITSSKTVKASAQHNLSDVAQESFTPAALSNTAYVILTQILLPYYPDIILIERQRWRSSGGAAIQEWTVRVNMLEGIIWALLTSFQRNPIQIPGRKDLTTAAHSTPGPEASAEIPFQVFDVSPKRVGGFWMETQESPSDSKSKRLIKRKDTLELAPECEIEDVVAKTRKAAKPLTRARAEKKAKIKLVQSWLASPTPATSSTIRPLQIGNVEFPNTPISFSFAVEAEGTKSALDPLRPQNQTRGKKSADGVPSLRKLDDVSDCFLQAAAWVAWEGNRLRLLREWESEPSY